MPAPAVYVADAMAQVDSIITSNAFDRPLMYGEHYGVALFQVDDLGARLHTRALLGEDELAPGEVLAGFRQQDRHLQREYVLAIQVLVQAVVVLRPVLQQQWSGALLTGGVAALDEIGVLLGKSRFQPHAFIPAIGQRYQLRIQRLTQLLDHFRQRISKILILAAPESMARHYYP